MSAGCRLVSAGSHPAPATDKLQGGTLPLAVLLLLARLLSLRHRAQQGPDAERAEQALRTKRLSPGGHKVGQKLLSGHRKPASSGCSPCCTLASPEPGCFAPQHLPQPGPGDPGCVPAAAHPGQGRPPLRLPRIRELHPRLDL
ncbi:PREDICTED: uncharacterized protein LOC108543847 [Rhinopithecus bieti]|uniref:uncharacterized protein LOC108543847 n=1 Tax=Rhinopithecus bieti TaxID=61621 RepID=UPI00083C82B8|nr:PREDICTED: uncharacterized protein LOC108543847 [Rhinopithecus bieti]